LGEKPDRILGGFSKIAGKRKVKSIEAVCGLRPRKIRMFPISNPRMDERQFSHADSLYQEVAAARYSLQLLVDHLHRIRCGPSYGAASAKVDLQPIQVLRFAP
jgi:hypothetical protein